MLLFGYRPILRKGQVGGLNSVIAGTYSDYRHMIIMVVNIIFLEVLLHFV